MALIDIMKKTRDVFLIQAQAWLKQQGLEASDEERYFGILQYHVEENLEPSFPDTPLASLPQKMQERFPLLLDMAAQIKLLYDFSQTNEVFNFDNLSLLAMQVSHICEELKMNGTKVKEDYERRINCVEKDLLSHQKEWDAFCRNSQERLSECDAAAESLEHLLEKAYLSEEDNRYLTSFRAYTPWHGLVMAISLEFIGKYNMRLEKGAFQVLKNCVKEDFHSRNVPLEKMEKTLKGEVLGKIDIARVQFPKNNESSELNKPKNNPKSVIELYGLWSQIRAGGIPEAREETYSPN